VPEEKTLMAEPVSSEDLGAAFSALRASLRNYLRRRVSDSVLVEDLIQDVFVKAAAAISANRAPKNLTGWLYAAARTAAFDHYRSARPDAMELDETMPDTEHTSDDPLHQELAMCLRPLARQLPAIYRDTLLATDFDRRTMQSLADEQGLSLSAIKSRASRARFMLKAKLLDCCHVEFSGGLVSDYYPRSPNQSCGGCT
jgi:RNA polymerase sigma-70 factor, ECF subfamily